MSTDARAGDRHDRERRSRRPPRAFSLAAALVFGSLAVYCVSLRHVRLVLTPSIPRGVYWVLPVSGPIPLGSLVVFCPPAAFSRLFALRHLEPPGRCPGGSIPLAKRLLARSPRLCAYERGLAVDGRVLLWPRIPPSLPLPRVEACGPTTPDCLFLVGDSPDSIDSRAFGCVRSSDVQCLLRPLWVERGGPR
jgi:type IV secretory pathway protease TraF